MATTPVGNPYTEASDLLTVFPGQSLALANRIDIVGVSLSDVDSVEIYDGSSWNPVAGGKILQVVQGVKNDTFSTSATSFTDITGLTATITPTQATSKIMVTAQFVIASGTATQIQTFNLVRDSTAIGQPAAGAVPGTLSQRAATANNDMQSCGIGFLDSPATTSATIYKIQVKVNGGTIYINQLPTAADYSSISTITLMEVAA